MTDIVDQLLVIRDHLRTGRFGQREVWEEWLTEAAAEIERLLGVCKDKTVLLKDAYADNERLRAALQDIAEDPYAVDGGAAEIARRALEPKP